MSYARWMLAASVWVYRRLLYVYPPTFRREYGPHMAQVFRDSLRDVYGRRGIAGLAQAWARGLIDLALAAPREHRAALGERRVALPSGASGIAVETPPELFQGAIRMDIENGIMLLIGFLVQSALWLWRAAHGSLLALMPIAGVLSVVCLLIAAHVLLRAHALQRAPAQVAWPAPPLAWRALILVVAGLYLMEVLLIPTLIPHTSALHDAMMYRWGLPGRIYYAFTGCVVFATVALVMPFSIAMILHVCRRRRDLSRAARRAWLAAPICLLALYTLTFPSAMRFVVWWGD